LALAKYSDPPDMSFIKKENGYACGLKPKNRKE